MDQHVDIEINRHGAGFVKVDGQSLPCCKVVISASVGGVPQVRLTLVPKRITVKLDGADVQTIHPPIGETPWLTTPPTPSPTT